MAQEHISGVLFPQAEEEKRRKKEEAARKKQEQEVTISLVYLVQGHREKNHTLSPATQFSVPSLGLDQVPSEWSWPLSASLDGVLASAKDRLSLVVPQLHSPAT